MDQAEILDYAVKTLVIILELSMLPIVLVGYLLGPRQGILECCRLHRP